MASHVRSDLSIDHFAVVKILLFLSAFSERKTISQYLEEDMQDTYTLKELQSDSRKTGKPGRRSRGRRLSLDPTTKIKVEKLEVVSNIMLI